MKINELAGYLLFPLLLLIAACAIHTCSLWSYLANSVVPWLCSALAIALLILGITCMLMQCKPADIPKKRAKHVVMIIMAILGTGFVVDIFAYNITGDWLASIGEWVGFAVILYSVFALLRTQNTVRQATS